jgi:hypothetical protein
MSTHSVDEPAVSTQLRSSEQGKDVWRGILTGLIPLGVLVIVVIATVLLTALARLLFAGSGFFYAAASGGDCTDRWIGTGHRRFWPGYQARPAASGALAADRGESAGQCSAVDAWRHRPGNCVTSLAGSPATTASLSMNDCRLLLREMHERLSFQPVVCGHHPEFCVPSTHILYILPCRWWNRYNDLVNGLSVIAVLRNTLKSKLVEIPLAAFRRAQQPYSPLLPESRRESAHFLPTGTIQQKRGET